MRWMMSVLLLGLCVGCDDGADSGEDPGAGGGEAPPQGDTFVAGLTKAGAAGALQVKLMDALPAPPERGDNRWLLAVEDMDGAALTGCTLLPTPRMPAHGHGSNTDPVVTEMGEGTYQADPLDLFMPGLWEIPIEVTCGDVTDTVQFAFWVEG